jgi:hypothetical protein
MNREGAKPRSLRKDIEMEKRDFTLAGGPEEDRHPRWEVAASPEAFLINPLRVPLRLRGESFRQ